MPAAWVLLAVATATLNTASVLRSGCEADEPKVAALPAGHAVEIQSALHGGSGTCYKVAAEVEGKLITGYVFAAVLSGVDSFEQARKSAKGLDLTAVAEEVKNVVAKAASTPGREHPARKAWDLINANQPAEALRLLERDLLAYPVDPFLHAVAGLAFYRMDNLERAILHWKESIAIRPDSSIEAMLKKAEREKFADKGSERMVGNRVVLRYERSTLQEPQARVMLQALDDEYTRVSFQLGCRANEKVTAIATGRESYFRATQAAEWSGGLYDGRIHVPVSDPRQVSPEIRRTFAHELTHACLHELGQWPSWLHEGLAQKYSGVTLGAQRAVVEGLIKAKQLPKLSQLGQNWSSLSSRNAAMAYTLALYAAEKLIERNANTGMRNILGDPGNFAQVEAELEKAIGL
ncbi:MAG TPA: hypothetical protein VM120_00620 [Bryobacteraceae bacterium]|nr:hypothetical protein [Bryobacteraceae bacterium]